MMARGETSELRARIRAAWRDAVYPGDDQICAPTYDDEGVGEYFRGRTWEGHAVRSLRYHEVGLSFFTAEAFAYYLAAYMLAVIDDAETADVICDGIQFHLSPGQLGKTWSTSYLRRLACLSPAQRDATIAYLEWYGGATPRRELVETIHYLRTGGLAGGQSPLDRLLRLGGCDGEDPATLVRLSLSSTKVTDAELVGLRALPVLEELDLGGTAITDRGLVEVGAVATLRVLGLASCDGLTAAGYAHLAGLRALDELGLANCELVDAVLDALAPLRLRRIDVTHARLVSPSGWAALDVSRLERLDMFGVHPPDELLERIGAAGRLRMLVAKTVRDAGAAALACTALESLDISTANQLTAAGLAALATLPALRRLNLGELAVERWPAGWPALEELTLLGIQLDAGVAAGIGTLPALRELRFFGRGLDPGTLAAVGRAPRLAAVTIYVSRGAVSLGELGESPALQRLVVESATITVDDLAALAQLPELTTLELSKVEPVDDDTLRALATVGVLELVIADMPLGDAGLAVLGGCPHLCKVRVKRARVTAEGLAAFRAAHPTIEVTDL